MKKLRTKLFASLILIAAAVLVMAAGKTLSQSEKSNQQRVRTVYGADGTLMTLPSDAIPDRVATEGNIKIYSHTEQDTMDLQLNVARADLAIQGVIEKATSRLAEDDTAIWTDYQVKIAQTLFTKQEAPGDFVIVSIRGGKMDFPNGTAEFISIDYQRLPEVGQEYIFFLKRYTPDKYLLVGGSQSAYQVIANKILPAAPQAYPVFRTFLGMGDDEFRTRITSERGRRPQ